MEGGEFGIFALIENDLIVFNNYACNVCAVPNAGPVTIDQTNRIESRIEVFNSGNVTGGAVGIYAAIPDAAYIPLNDVYGFDPATLNRTESTTITSGIRIENTGSSGPMACSPSTLTEPTRRSLTAAMV